MSGKRNRHSKGRKSNRPNSAAARKVKVDKLSAERTSPGQTLFFMSLPNDVLYQILTYLDVRSLGRLCRVCKTLNDLASADSLWNRRLFNQEVQIQLKKRYQIDSESRETTNGYINSKMRYISSKNWKTGRFDLTTCVDSWKTKLLPWLQRDDQSNLWMSYKNVIQCYSHIKRGYIHKIEERQLTGLSDDVSRFVVKGDLIVSGCRDGSVCGWNNITTEILFHYPDHHEGETHCVDFGEGLLVSGSRDKYVKIVNTKTEHMNTIYIYIGDRVWSLTLDNDISAVAVGSAGNKGLPPLTTWDIQTGLMISTLGVGHQRGAGITDIRFNTPHTLLTCGYDTRLCLWDLRSNKREMCWTEPFDESVFCFDTDDNHMMVTGLARYGMTRLWDNRTTKPIQQYYTASYRSSPVYSLTFDPLKMFLAIDRGLYVLDFLSPQLDEDL